MVLIYTLNSFFFWYSNKLPSEFVLLPLSEFLNFFRSFWQESSLNIKKKGEWFIITEELLEFIKDFKGSEDSEYDTMKLPIRLSQLFERYIHKYESLGFKNCSQFALHILQKKRQANLN